MPLDDSDPSPVWEASETGIVICPGLSWDEWLERWEPLQHTHRALNFWLGDAILFAEDSFPDQWTQALDPQYADQHRNALWVARRIPPAERVEGISWSAHRECASLEPAERNEILALAKAQGWGAREVAGERKRRQGKANSSGAKIIAGLERPTAPVRVIDHDEGSDPPLHVEPEPGTALALAEDLPAWLDRLRSEYADHPDVIQLIGMLDITDSRLRRLSAWLGERYGVDAARILQGLEDHG